jgi:copper chaperone CopZ
MKKLFLILAAIITFSSPALADHNGKAHGPFKTIIVGVDGMVCDFCARSMEKIFYQEDGVQGVIIDLDKESMTLEIDEAAAITDERIKERVYYAGYKVRDIKR